MMERMAKAEAFQPLLTAGAAYAAALLAASFFGYHSLLVLCAGVAAVCVLAALLAGFGVWKSRRASVTLLFAAAALAVAVAGRVALLKAGAEYAGREVAFAGKIEDVRVGSRVGYLVRAQSGEVRNGTRILVYAGSAPEFYEGETISLTAKLKETPPSRSQMGLGADLVGDTLPENIRLLSAARGVRGWIGRLRAALRSRLYRALSPDAAGFFEAVLLGDSDALTPALRRSFEKSGASHLLCVSGLHISMLMGGAGWIFRRLFGAGKGAFLLTVLAGGGFVLLTGAAPSAVRAWIMAAVSLAAAAFCRDSSPGNNLGGAVLLLCLANPRVVMQNGFWLSVLASAAMFGAAPRWKERALGRLPQKLGAFPLVQGIASSLSGTLAVTLFCLPVFLFQSGSISLLAPLSNLLLVPVFPLVMMGGAVCLLGGSAAAPFGAWFGRALNQMFELVSRMAEVSWASLPLGFPWIPVWAAVTLLLLCIGAVPRRKKRMGLALACSAAILAAGFAVETFSGKSSLKISAVTTEKGGSWVLSQNGSAAVIGCGGDGRIGGKTAAYLQSIGTVSVESLWIPRESRRCMSGAAGLFGEIPVKTVYAGGKSNWYQLALDAENVGACRPLSAGKTGIFDGVTLEFACPDGQARFAVSAAGRRLLFLSERDPDAARVAAGADAVFFYEEIPGKDGAARPEYAIIKEKRSWMDSFSEWGEQYAAAAFWIVRPDGRIQGRAEKE